MFCFSDTLFVDTKIGDDGAKAIGEALKANSSLLKLNVDRMDSFLFVRAQERWQEEERK